MPVFVWTLTRGLVQQPNPKDTANRNTCEPVKLLGHLRGLTVEGLFLLKDFARHLEDPAVCREFRDLAEALAQRRSTLVITGSGHHFPPEAEAHVLNFELAMPGPKELGDVVAAVVRSMRGRQQTPVELDRTQLDALLAALAGMTCNQARQAVAAAILRDGKLSAEDIPKILDEKAQLLGHDGILEYFPAEDSRYELGGFDRLKAWLERARVGFSKEARDLGLTPPKGVLMVGVQGCGKSLAAKSIARSWGLPLLKLDAGRLFDKYIGQSEKNLRHALALAESMAPAVLWIDEIEKSFASFQGSEGDGGVSQRIFATLLGWLQDKKQEVFVVATANDVFRLPPELLRKGRFDEIFFVDLPDAEERRSIFEIHLRTRKQKPESLDLPALVAASEGFSGAEIEQAVISGLYRALYEKRPLETRILADELAGTVPLSRSRREDLAKLRALAAERFVPVH